MSPPALENKPPLYDWMQEYLSGFYTLNNTRQYGFGPSPISLTEIHTYLQLYGASDPAAFIEHIMAMDSAFLIIKAELAETQNKGKSSNGERAGRK